MSSLGEAGLVGLFGGGLLVVVSVLLELALDLVEGVLAFLFSCGFGGGFGFFGRERFEFGV